MPNLALFDFDGTITTNDHFTAFVRIANKPQRLILGKIVLSPIILGYKLGVVSGPTIRKFIVRIGFYGMQLDEIQHLGDLYSRNEIPKFIRSWALAKILWHKDQNDVVVVVSSSLDVYLQSWCSGMGIELICSSL